jgi:phage-related protein
VVEAVIDKVTGVFERLFTAGQNLMEKLKGGITDTTAAVREAAETVGTKIVLAFADAGEWLYDAGVAIMNGLWDGLKDKWKDVANWFGSIPGKIKDLKGPLPKDKILLIPEGEGIMEGLAAGLRNQFKEVKRELARMAPELSRTMGANLTAMVELPSPPLSPAAMAGASSRVENHYNTTLQSPAGTIADPRIALAQLDAELRARGGVG